MEIALAGGMLVLIVAIMLTRPSSNGYVAAVSPLSGLLLSVLMMFQAWRVMNLWSIAVMLALLAVFVGYTAVDGLRIALRDIADKRRWDKDFKRMQETVDAAQSSAAKINN